MEFISEKSGERLDKFLTSRLVKFSRSKVQRLIKDGLVKVNGSAAAKTGVFLKVGDEINVPEDSISDEELKIEPEPDIPLDIVYEDKDILVINKQSGLLVHPTLNQKKHTLVNALVARYPKIIGVGENILRPGIVHRLDKETSGLMAVAKNQKAFDFLKSQFLKREVKKTYFALVEGILKDKSGDIKYQIRPSRINRLKKVAIKKRNISGKKSVREAETHYELEKIFQSGFSLVSVMPKTGRTHQIRVHLAAIGHPVVGDIMYGAKQKIAQFTGTQAQRQMLHAYKLEFKAPNGKKLVLESEMPSDMKDLLKGLENRE